MADQQNDKSAGLALFSDADKDRARQWFKKAADTREKRDYDYAIECYLTGLGFWPDATDDGLLPLRSLWVQRQQAGGKKPGMLDGMKKPTGGKDAKQNLLNAFWLLARDPQHYTYAEAALKAAAAGGYGEAVKFVAPLALELLRKEAKPNLARFKAVREALLEVSRKAESSSDYAMQVWTLEQAVASIDFLRARVPENEELRNEQRDLSSRLTITRGKYSQDGSFRESVRDADKQRVLHDTERVQQGDSTLEALIAGARAELAKSPNDAPKVGALVELLCRRERREEELDAIAVLTKAYADTRNYSFKMRADDIRIKQLQRQTRDLAEKARGSGAEDDKLNARLSATEMLETELDIYAERVRNYPTDQRLKARYGATLFKARRYDDAIPVLQEALAEPRGRARCQLLIGRAFFEKGVPSEAREVLRDALEGYDVPGDDLHKELTYWLARSYEADGAKADALATYGKLLRTDYNYGDGEARKRMEALK